MRFEAELQNPSSAYALVILCSTLCYGDPRLWRSTMSIEPLHYCLWWLNQRIGRLPLLYIAPTKSTSEITIMRTIAKHCLATLFLTHANIGGLLISCTSVLSRVVHRHFCCIYCNNFLFVFGSVLYVTSVGLHYSCCVYNTNFGRCAVGLRICSMWYFLRKNIAKNR